MEAHVPNQTGPIYVLRGGAISLHPSMQLQSKPQRSRYIHTVAQQFAEKVEIKKVDCHRSQLMIKQTIPRPAPGRKPPNENCASKAIKIPNADNVVVLRARKCTKEKGPHAIRTSDRSCR